MPDLSGLDCIRQLLAEGYHFVSIIITGFGEFEYARQALLLGATDIILKPIDNQTLIFAICRAFQIPYTPKVKEKHTTETISSDTPKNFTSKAKQKTVSQAIQYMQDHLSQKITLNDLADYLNVSRSHLSRCFREEYQKSFIKTIVFVNVCKNCIFLSTICFFTCFSLFSLLFCPSAGFS